MSVQPAPTYPRRRAALAAALVMLAALLVPSPPAVAAPDNAPAASQDGTEVGAAREAARTGRPVEVTALTSETRQVFAKPNGTFTAVLSVQPVRVRRGPAWRPVDTTLARAADGSVAPVATSLDMVFSGGGTGPLVRVDRDGAQLALWWPGALPQPVLSGNTATYQEVLPGVDLTVRADVEGFSHLLVVKSAQAARNPALARLRFATRVTGLALKAAPDGSLAAVDPRGRTVLQAPAPDMWDSSGVEHQASGRLRALPAQLTGGELSLVPDQGLLADASTRYPVFIDPAWSGARTAWTQVWSNLSTTSFWNGANVGGSSGEARVGYDATDAKQTRSFFRFDTSGVKGRHILKATLQTFETWSRSCTARQVEVWETGGISSATTWKAQPTWITRLDYKSLAKGYSSSCAAGGVEFNVTAHVVKAAANGWDAITEGMRASTTAESNKDTLSWKKFRNNPSITVEYNTVPNTPTSLTTDGSATCATGSGRLAIGTTMPTLRATVSDPDNAVQARFEWWSLDGTAALGSYTSASVAGKTPTVVSTTVPSGTFANGAIGKWRVRAEDGTDTSGWSAWCEFQVDTSQVPIPTVTSTAFPDNGTGNAVMGTAVSVTFGANGDANVTGYEYTLNGDATALDKTAVPPSAGGSATVEVTPDRFVNWINVRAVHAAGTRSEVATVVFYAATAGAPVGDWRLDETGDGGVAVDSSANARTATLGGGATWGDGVVGGGLHLDGINGYAATSTAVLDTLKSFSVSAWVRLGSTSRNAVILTQVGSHASAFALYYSSSYNRWIFNRTTVDADSTTFVRAISTTVPATGVWTHLFGVYDAPNQQVRLYVNGALEGQNSFTSPWSATGPLQIGRSKVASVFGEYWPGDVDAVQAFNRIPLPGELAQVPRLDGQWKLDETSGTTAADVTGKHPAAWSASGVSRITGISGNAVSVDGTAGVLSTTGAAIRTDGSFTVSSWVRPGALAKNGIAVSQLGGSVGGFNLGWSWSSDYGAYLWSVRTSAADASGSALREAVDLFDQPTVGTWTMLTTVYDAAEHSLRLYVNGQAVAETRHASTWNAAGNLLFGRGQAADVTFSQYLTGGIDDVRVYSGVLSDQEIYGLYAAITQTEPAS